MSELEELQAKRAEIMAKINAIESAKERKENALLVNKCFKVKNNYSASEAWWLYTIVQKQLYDGDLYATQFEITSNGSVQINSIDYFSPRDGFIEITADELMKAWEITLDTARNMMKF